MQHIARQSDFLPFPLLPPPTASCMRIKVRDFSFSSVPSEALGNPDVLRRVNNRGRKLDKSIPAPYETDNQQKRQS
jgi:hypothetical protein